jgi:pimeloyl-ACP methyl ester carboxylesterase
MVRGHRLHGRRFGTPSAPLVLGAHGLTGDGQSFEFLGERIGGDAIQFVALDLRGRGNSEATPPGTYGWENHALDLLAIADALGFERFSIIGKSMGGSVAMKAAELDGARLDAIVLVDIAGRVDRGVGPVIESVIAHLATEGAESAPPASVDAVVEDREYTATQDPYRRWRHLTMPTLLLRATRELEPGAGYVVPADDVARFKTAVPHAVVVEVDANHITINAHPRAAEAISDFLGNALGTSVR